jgi:hypothetical protein
MSSLLRLALIRIALSIAERLNISSHTLDKKLFTIENKACNYPKNFLEYTYEN